MEYSVLSITMVTQQLLYGFSSTAASLYRNVHIFVCIVYIVSFLKLFLLSALFVPLTHALTRRKEPGDEIIKNIPSKGFSYDDA